MGDLYLTAGYGNSKHASAVLQLLIQQGHTVHGVILYKMSAKRVIAYVKRLGRFRAASRYASRGLGLGRAGRQDPEVEPVLKFMEKCGLSSEGVSAVASTLGVPVLPVRSFSDEQLLAKMRSHPVDAVVYCGGGIVRGDLIGIPRIGILNAHAGPLPEFRGMNASEWSVIHGVEPVVTTMIIDEGIDTGDIVAVHAIEGIPARSVGELRGLATVASIKALVADIDRLLGGTVKPREQMGKGDQYFTMANELVEVLNTRLERGSTLMSQDKHV